jgi:hypothetical protein
MKKVKQYGYSRRLGRPEKGKHVLTSGTLATIGEKGFIEMLNLAEHSFEPKTIRGKYCGGIRSEHVQKGSEHDSFNEIEQLNRSQHLAQCKIFYMLLWAFSAPRSLSSNGAAPP